ncbi:MAG: hypothetical protein Q6355_10620, partial [Candidatus Brocadiales bacterium]|nr:hypothetical protein [Candidatus Brocadiales bacterium]
MDDKTHFQINPARNRYLSPSGGAGNENVLHLGNIRQQKTRKLLLSLFFILIIPSLFLADTADAAFGTTTVDNTGTTGLYTSIAVGTSGAAYISYQDAGAADDLKYATNVSGSFVTTTVDSTNVTGLYTSIAVGSSGAVYISYQDSTTDDLKYATNVSGSFGTTTVDSTNLTGLYTSIAVGSSGAAYISYYDITTDDLKYATNVSGSFGTT